MNAAIIIARKRPTAEHKAKAEEPLPGPAKPVRPGEAGKGTGRQGFFRQAAESRPDLPKGGARRGHGTGTWNNMEHETGNMALEQNEKPGQPEAYSVS